jgi:hypothetical protein
MPLSLNASSAATMGRVVVEAKTAEAAWVISTKDKGVTLDIHWPH